jgi:hypothetical protein
MIGLSPSEILAIVVCECDALDKGCQVACESRDLQTATSTSMQTESCTLTSQIVSSWATRLTASRLPIKIK